MNRNAEMENDGAMLAHIVVLLFALAELAERAACRSHPVRRQVLAILRPAEAVARGMVPAAGPLQVLFAKLAAIAFGRGDSPADAMRMALRLRALASALDDLPAQTLRLAQCFDPAQFKQPGAIAPWMAGRMERRQAEQGETGTVQPYQILLVLGELARWPPQPTCLDSS